MWPNTHSLKSNATRLDEANVLEFDLQVSGTSAKTSDIRFIIEGHDYSILCKCEESKGGVSVEIPKLKGILPAGLYETRLEVVIDGKLFTPLTESIELEPLIEFEVGKRAAKQPIKEEVTVSVKSVSAKLSNYMLAESEGFSVTKHNGLDILTKGNRYYGFISEKKYLKSENVEGFETVTDLMKSI